MMRGLASQIKCTGRGKHVNNESKTNLLELLDGTLVDTTALVDEMAGL